MDDDDEVILLPPPFPKVPGKFRLWWRGSIVPELHAASDMPKRLGCITFFLMLVVLAAAVGALRGAGHNTWVGIPLFFVLLAIVFRWSVGYLAVGGVMFFLMVEVAGPPDSLDTSDFGSRVGFGLTVVLMFRIFVFSDRVRGYFGKSRL